MPLDRFINSVRTEVAKRFDLKTDAEIDAFFIGLEESAKDNQETLEKRDKMLRDTVAELCEAKRLLKAAVEGFKFLGAWMDEHGDCTLDCSECPLHRAGINCRCWNKRDEALALIGEDTNVPASKDDTNVGAKIDSWISCKDKMPDDNTSVLFVYVSENGIKSVHYGYHQTLKGLGSSWAKPSGGWQYCDDDVTHWQPVPEPPKE